MSRHEHSDHHRGGHLARRARGHGPRLVRTVSVRPSNRTLLTASYAAEAHLATASHALGEVINLLRSLGPAPGSLLIDTVSAEKLVRKVRANLDTFKKRIP